MSLGLQSRQHYLVVHIIWCSLRWVVGVELDLVNGGCGLEARVGEQLLEVLNSEVGNTNVLHTARLGELLHLSPGVLEVPVGVVLLEILGVAG
jgi:hypothetical protein